MELDTIASLGGSFYVSPTIIFSSNAQVAITAISGTTVTAAFIDSSSINTDTIGGVQWTNYSKIKISGRLGDVILGNNGNTCSGTLTAKMNTTAGRINCTFTCDQASSLSVKTYAASEVHDLRVMIYEKGVNSSTSYPVGMLLTGYGTNNNSYIDIYQGEDTRTKPRVRLGKLDGLDASIKVGDVSPTGFGLYADNVFLKGTIHSTAGIIGGWTISDGKLYYTANTPGSNSSILAPGGVSSTVDIAGSGTSSHSWAFTIKNIFGVTTAGDLYSSSGKIGGWTIGPTSLVNGTWGTSGSAMMCTGTSGTKQIGGSASISGWTFSSGANFGVTSSGALYCSDAHVQGEITATSGTIGGCSITNGVLQVASANISSIDASKITSGTISADRIGAGSISADKLSATAIIVGGRNILHGTDSMVLGSGGWPVGQFAQSASTIDTSLFRIDIANAPIPNIKKGVRLKATSSQTSPGYGQGKYPMYGHIGDVLTYSAWVKCSKANQVVRLQAFSDGTSGISETSSKDFTIATANKWTHISYTTAAIQYDHSTMTIGYVYLRNGAANDTVEVCGQMLEWGNRASDWTPSPDEIGGLAIDATSIHTANVAVTSNADNSIALSSADFQRTINGTARDGLRLAIGDKFGVTGDGKIYASSVDLTGKITATSGAIAGWRIESSYMASGTATGPTANTLLLSPNGTSSSYTVAGTASTGWMITAGTTFGVNKNGGVYATSGKIGGWTIGATYLVNGTWGEANSAMMSVGTSGAKSIGGSESISGWTFTSGSKFGVTNTGALYCNEAHIQGEITATSGYIGGAKIVDGILTVGGINIISNEPNHMVNTGLTDYYGNSDIINNNRWPKISGNDSSTSLYNSNSCDMVICEHGVGFKYNSSASSYYSKNYIIFKGTQNTLWYTGLEKNTQYTLSFDAEYKLFTAAAPTQSRFYINTPGYQSYYKVNNRGTVNEEKISFTFTTPSTNESTFYIYVGSNDDQLWGSSCASGDYFYMKNIMLSKGDTAAVYQPSRVDDWNRFEINHRGQVTLTGIEYGYQGISCKRANGGYVDMIYYNEDLSAILLSGSSSISVIPGTAGISLGNSNYKWGNIYATNGTIQTSDEREKDFTYMYNKYSNLFMSIKPIEFTWKNNTDKHLHLGIGAQTLEKSMKDLGYDNMHMLQYDKESDSYSVIYTELQMLTIPVVQDHEYRIRQLEKENKYLREKIELLIKEGA